ncbi:MAG: VOC family protein [Acidimicrobiales bacterium]|nr:VOC family protein [Acidimicrobiales bacterium]
MNQPPVGHLAHFAVNADDIDASRRFYESVFGWQFKAWGPPGFFHIHDANGDQPGPIGVVQARRDLVDGQPTTGFECTIAVDDVDRAASAAVELGGRVLMDKTTIAGVGDLIFVADPSGHPVGLMRYDPGAE